MYERQQSSINSVAAQWPIFDCHREFNSHSRKEVNQLTQQWSLELLSFYLVIVEAREMFCCWILQYIDDNIQINIFP